MFSNKKRIFFRVDGDHGKLHGLGHVNRIIKIYKKLKANKFLNYEYYFITKKNTLGHFILKKYTSKKIVFLNEIKKKINFNEKDKIIIDTLGADKSFLKILKTSKVEKIISFEETKSNFYNKAIIINGIYFTKKKIFN